MPLPFQAPARRNAHGLDNGRLALLLAVLERHAGLRLTDHDVYASTVGGVRLAEPGADLAVAVAVASAVTDRPIDRRHRADGRGRAQRVRCARSPTPAAGWPRPPGSASVVPSCPSAHRPVDGVELVRAGTVAEALAAAGLAGVAGPAGPDRGRGPGP